MFVVKRKSDGKYYINSAEKHRRSWYSSGDKNVLWTNDLQQVLPYRTRSGPKRTFYFSKKPFDSLYDIIEVKLITV